MAIDIKTGKVYNYVPLKIHYIEGKHHSNQADKGQTSYLLNYVTTYFWNVSWKLFIQFNTFYSCLFFSLVKFAPSHFQNSLELAINK